MHISLHVLACSVPRGHHVGTTWVPRGAPSAFYWPLRTSANSNCFLSCIAAIYVSQCTVLVSRVSVSCVSFRVHVCTCTFEFCFGFSDSFFRYTDPDNKKDWDYVIFVFHETFNASCDIFEITQFYNLHKTKSNNFFVALSKYPMAHGS